jgi:hypothetical protein
MKFCCAALSSSTASQSPTRLLKEHMAESTLRGQLRQLQVPDLLQYLQVIKTTGKLELRCDQRLANIFFDAGRVVHAECRGLVGAEAFAALLELDNVDFEVLHGVLAPMTSIRVALPMLLGRSGPHVSSVEYIEYDLKLVPRVLGVGAQVTLGSEGVILLTRINGQTNLRTLCEGLAWTSDRLFAAVHTLESSGLIVLESPRAAVPMVDVRIMQALRQACISSLGPVGALVFDGALEDVRISVSTLPQGRWGAFLQVLAQSIDEPNSRARFVKAVSEMRARFGI